MARGTGASISSPLSPSRDAPGLIGRFLQRTTSKKKTKQFHQRSTGTVASKEELLLSPEANRSQPHLSESRTPAAAAPQQQRNSSTTAPNAASITQPQPHELRQSSRTSTEAAAATPEMPSTIPQPQLKKRASFRDRLKAWQKPPQSLETADETTPRFVYEPKHAAADFSRLVVSPMSPTRPRPAPPMQTLAEDDSPAVVTAPHASQRRSQNRDRGHTIPHRDDDTARRQRDDDDPATTAKRHRRSGSNPTAAAPPAKRHSYTLTEDPFAASQAAAHVPGNSWPTSWTPGVQSAARREQEQQQQPASSSPPPQPPSSTPPAPLALALPGGGGPKPASDYELFIARAEAQDRERREQVLRSLSQRSTGAGGHARVKPDPHRQYAAAAVGSAEGQRRGDGSRQRNGGGGGRYVGEGKGEGEVGVKGRKEQQQQQRAQKEQQQQQQQWEHREQQREKRAGGGKGHVRHASWGRPSYTTGSSGGGSGSGNGVDKALERKLSPVQQPPRAQARVRHPAPAEPVLRQDEPVRYSVDAGFDGAGGYKAQAPRMLRRQASLTKRFVEYIRPAKMEARVETLVE